MDTVLRLYDSLSRAVSRFRTLEPGRARVYVCGMTVDGAPHLGHARSAVVFDVLVRHLEARGHAVTYVRNFTDVDDRILRRARAEGLPPEEVAARNVAAYRRVMTALAVRRPDHEPRVTEHVGDIVAMIETLVARGAAYVADGDVFFDVASKADYGKLSGRRVEDQEAGARVEVDERKRAAADFALWKAAKPGEPSWPSPWGAGRPGWHIECSAMVRALLGDRIDVHGGGSDLRFPHHENEIAQSESATGLSPVASFWVHNGMVTVADRDGRGEKMAKSLGNAIAVEDVLARHPAEALRAWFLLAHYRTPLEASERSLGEAALAVERLHEAIAEVSSAGETLDARTLLRLEETVARAVEAVGAALDDDLDTPAAFAALFTAGSEVRRLLAEVAGPPSPDGTSRARALVARLRDAASPLGVLREDAERYVGDRRRARIAAGGVDAADVDRALAERDDARRERDFARADRIKDSLRRRGVVLRDGPRGTTWDVEPRPSPSGST